MNLYSLVGGSSLTIVVVICATIRHVSRQRRLKHRDDLDYALRWNVFSHDPTVSVLTDIPALREAERPFVQLPGRKPEPPPATEPK